ncbi:hypothetical protein [Paucibacter sp. KBW04]|uniref:hypothetical protein n=1 Tax=Paucibacter sp. KBW04 TaxID=2153361 RepID=UPI000F566114|nr:hypothetical protein [Paucibacter sp. KBW04]
MPNRFIPFALALAIAGPALAAGEDLAACRWANGAPIDPVVCDGLRELAARDAEKAKRDADTRARGERDEASREAQQLALKAEAEERMQAAKARKEGDAYWLQQGNEKMAAEQKKYDSQLAEQARQDKTRRQVCGADYAKPTVGMPLARARSCVGELTLVSQVNRNDGVASVYRAGRLQLVVMNEKVVAWQRW